MVGDSLTGAGKRPSFDHSNKVVLLKGRNGKMSLARPMPVSGIRIASECAVTGWVSVGALPVKEIAWAGWCVCRCVIFNFSISVTLCRGDALRYG